jgi:hypothetical protein
MQIQIIVRGEPCRSRRSTCRAGAAEFSECQLRAIHPTAVAAHNRWGCSGTRSIAAERLADALRDRIKVRAAAFPEAPNELLSGGFASTIGSLQTVRTRRGLRP